jgi:hypothetical protein
MGYDELDGALPPVTHKNLWAGWFPNKVQGGIPGELFDPSQPIGLRDCNNVIYDQGRLKKMFGYNNVNSSALESGAAVTSLFYSPVLSEFVGTVGTKLYKDMATATPTDVTGTATITTNTQTHIAEWQFETDKYVIGVQQGNAPWAWTGTGNAAALGGSPPQGKWVSVWQNCVWISNTSTEPSTLYFSNLGDPTTWTTNDDYKWEAPITGQGVLGNMFVVFTENSINILMGDNVRKLTQVHKYISNIGCTGGFTVASGSLNGQEVLLFHAADGFYAFDGTRNVIKLSKPIDQKYVSGTAASRWNAARLANACSTWVPKHNWYITGISDGSDTQNGFVHTQDLSRPFALPDNQGAAVPQWPASDQVEEVNCITVGKDANSAEWIYFGSDDGYVYKYDPALFNRNGSAYTSYATSKIFDTGQTLLLLESNIVGNLDGSAGEVVESINFDLESGLGQSDTNDMNTATAASVLDSTFILDSSILSDKEFIFKNFEISNWGRFFQFDVRNTRLDHQMNIQGLNFVFKSLGIQPNASY